MIFGTRPEAIKMAPVVLEAQKRTQTMKSMGKHHFVPKNLKIRSRTN